ncbi:MAG: WhiB family transcriptional regulator [Pseudonocardiaceae bacterium]
MIAIDRLAPHQQVAGQKPACWAVDPEIFFGPADSPAGALVHVWERRALAVCAGCPVVTACLAEALEVPAAEQYGVVGDRGAAAGGTAGIAAEAWASAATPKGKPRCFPQLGASGYPGRKWGPAPPLAHPALRWVVTVPSPSNPAARRRLPRIMC